MKEHRLRHHLLPHLLVLCFVGLLASFKVEAYKNYTVGDSLGWFDNTEKPNLNYQKWAASKNFSLGDFLLFNTNTNHSVVQTYNETVYELCDDNGSEGNDTIEWSNLDPSNTATQLVTVPVPLLKEGTSYFFSSDYDGDQCKNGMHFKINVTHGRGLPESLKSPDEQAPAPNSPDVSGDDVVPDTIVPANFDNPKDMSDSDNDKVDSGSISLHLKFLEGKLNGILIFLGVVCLYF
ncbi:early nodulin-like protein 18 [Euphorbia lathyris]|uniref:early nodulin-like protein 18 n=1 Tax=Euphorbia lathyris TaxID=212925 RepID=UPI003313DD3D